MRFIVCVVLVAALIAVAFAAGKPAKGKAPGKRVKFDQNFVVQSLNEFRHDANPKALAVQWVDKLAVRSWSLAKTCNSKFLDKRNNAGMKSLWGPIAWQGKFPMSYANDYSLIFIEDLLEDACPLQLLSQKTKQVGCAVARCPKLKGKNVRKIDADLKKDTWDAVVCTFGNPVPKKCWANGKGRKRGRIGSAIKFSKAHMLDLLNDVRQARGNLADLTLSKALTKKAQAEAKKCIAKAKKDPKASRSFTTIVPKTAFKKLKVTDLDLNIQNTINLYCPNLVLNPLATQVGCAGTICGRRPKANLKQPWHSFTCVFNKPVEIKKCWDNM